MILPAGITQSTVKVALIRGANEIVELDAGKRFVIGMSPGGVEVLDEVVPAGKHWSICVSITVTETDA